MRFNKIVPALIYLVVFLILIFPSSNMEANQIVLMGITFYVFEIPLLFLCAISLMIALMRRKALPRSVVSVYGAFILIGFIGFFQALYLNDASTIDIVKDLRPILYWLSGIVVVFVGCENVNVKTLTWTIIAGLLIQLIWSVLLLRNNPYLLIEGNGRLGVRSGWLALFFLSLLIQSITGATKRSTTVIMAILMVPLMAMAIMGGNRTTWILLAAMGAWYFLFIASLGNKLRVLFLVPLLIVITIAAIPYLPINSDIMSNIHERLFISTLSSEGQESAMGKRSPIYQAGIEEIQKHPILGSGFGKYLLFYGFTEEHGTKENSSTDNCYLDVVVKTGIIGLILYIWALFKIFRTYKKAAFLETMEERIYFKTLVFAFPFLILASMNISILYGYPEAMIFSVVFAKAACIECQKNSIPAAGQP